jgi:hypothetical protein
MRSILIMEELDRFRNPSPGDLNDSWGYCP